MKTTTIIAFFALSSGLLCRGQLNYEGNPLTEGIEYTAQESQSSGLDAGRNYERFEVADGRMRSLSEIPFAVDSLANARRNEKISTETNSKEEYKDFGLAGISDSISDEVPSGEFVKDEEPPVAFSKPAVESRPEARQFRGYQKTGQPLFHQQVPPVYGQPEAIPTTGNPEPGVAMTQSEALDKFLNSKTPEESEIALSTYLSSQERANRAQDRNFQETSVQNGARVQETVNAIENEIPTTYEKLARQNDVPVGATEADNQIHQYSPRFPYTINAAHQNFYASPRWAQWRYDPAMRRYPTTYRGVARPRTHPWAQSRLGPSPGLYYPKGPISSPWKSPAVEVIYTKPPGPSVDHVVSNPPVRYEDAGKYFSESDSPPPKNKDIYYSQLWAQSYDPHYYNYIAKTGKIKPWLYGKLGKSEENSIWWDLYTGFKNNGLKNMMHPMFLLGMSIPTLTLMLSALIQKRSLGRSGGSSYSTREFVEKYEPQIRAAILAYQNQIEENKMSTGENKSVQKRSIDGRRVREALRSHKNKPSSLAKRWQLHLEDQARAKELAEDILLKEKREERRDSLTDDDEKREKGDELEDRRDENNDKSDEEKTNDRSIEDEDDGEKNLSLADRWHLEIQDPATLFFLQNQEYYAAAILAEELVAKAKRIHQESGKAGNPTIDDELLQGYNYDRSFLEYAKKLAQATLAQEKQINNRRNGVSVGEEEEKEGINEKKYKNEDREPKKFKDIEKNYMRGKKENIEDTTIEQSVEEN